jgi:hypothetical protein
MGERRSKHVFGIRGIMADPARLVERHEFYFALLEDMAAWGMNTLWWHFTDDEGFMLRLKSHPELATPHAFSRAEMKRLIARAAELGIDVVPEVESLGHARCITRLRKYRELADGPEYGFNAICPSHPRTLPLLAEIINEVAELFPSRCFHAGLDEVDFGDCPRCRRRGRGKPHWWVYARHVRAVHAIVRAAGKEMIIWADHVEKGPGMLRALPKDIILAHWQYGAVRADAIRRSLRAGFRVVGCPALCHSGDMIMPNAANYDNMDAMTQTMAKLRPRSAVLGVVNTWWTLWRGLRDAYLPAAAYTGEMLRRGGPLGRPGFMRRFARERFGLTGRAGGDALWALHQAMLSRQEVAAALFDSPTDMHAALALAAHGTLADRGARLAEATRSLRRCAPGVRTHRKAFDALVLAGRIAALCCEQVEALASAVEDYRRAEAMHESGHRIEQAVRPLRAAARTLRRMQRSVETLARAADREWDRTRYGDDPKKGIGRGRRFSLDALLPKLDRCRRFLAKLSGGLEDGVARYRKTGVFPFGL